MVYPKRTGGGGCQKCGGTIDTAQAYENETGVGGVLTCGIPREEMFVTSKIAAEAKTYEAAAESIDESIRKMRLDYLDMMIIHRP